MRGSKRKAMWALCCVLLLAAIAARGADDGSQASDVAESEEVDAEEVDDDEEVDIDEECVEQPLGLIARHGLVSHLAQHYPWITQPIVEASLVACEDDDPTEVEVNFEPHLFAPRWERSWTVSCERAGMLDWSCEYPEERTLVYLAEGDAAVPITPEVSPGEALEALAAIVIQSAEPGGIPDPFDASDPFLDLTVDSVLSVTREEICAGLLVAVQLDPESPKNQFCVERPQCATPGTCPWTVRVEGTTE